MYLAREIDDAAPPAVRGPVETYFHTLTRPRRDCARVPLSARCLLLFHRRLHGDMHACRAHVPVKTACESEQTQSVQRYMRRKNSDSFLTREAVGVKTLSRPDSSCAQRHQESDVPWSIRYRCELAHRPAAPSARAPQSACSATTLGKNLCQARVSQRPPESRTHVRISS